MSEEVIIKEGNKYYATKNIKDNENKDLPFKLAIVIDNGKHAGEYNGAINGSKKEVEEVKLVNRHIIFDGQKIRIDEYNCPHTEDIDAYVRKKGYTASFYNRYRVNYEVRKYVLGHLTDVKYEEEKYKTSFNPPEHKPCQNNKCSWTSYIINKGDIIIAYFQGELEINGNIKTGKVTNYGKILPGFKSQAFLEKMNIKVDLLKKLYQFTFRHLKDYGVRKIELKNLTDAVGFVGYTDAASDAGYSHILSCVSERRYLSPFTPITRLELMNYIPYNVILLSY